MAGVDVSRFLAGWFEDVGTASTAHALHELATDPDELRASTYGQRFLVGPIAPRVWGDRGSREELLLHAVSALGAPRAGTPLAGLRRTVNDLFARCHAPGAEEVACRLRVEVSERVRVLAEPGEACSRWQAAIHRSSDDEPGRIAAHEPETAKATHRDLRAARALAPVDAPWMPAPAARW